MKSTSNGALTYWKQQEAQLNEAILQKGLLHIIHCDSNSIPDNFWCLGIVTASRLLIQGGATQNWFSHMIQSSEPQKPTPLHIDIPRSEISLLSPIIPVGFLGKLFQRTNVYRLQWTRADGTTRLTVEVEKDADIIISLQKNSDSY